MVAILNLKQPVLEHTRVLHTKVLQAVSSLPYNHSQTSYRHDLIFLSIYLVLLEWSQGPRLVFYLSFNDILHSPQTCFTFSSFFAHKHLSA